MANSWKNQKRPADTFGAVAFRIPKDLRAKLIRFVGRNNTTQAAVFRAALEEFMQKHGSSSTSKPKGESLFD